MIYRFLKIVVGIAIRIFCRKIIINDPDRILNNGPLLLASNHPNSFLDAVILDIIFPQPVYSLARGDVFVNKLISSLLRKLNILPVYRVSEGVENLSSNYETFDACKDIFKNNGTILIFSEGKCINEWRLRPLKKGTARLAIDSWENDIPLKVLPVGINYSSFKRFGKNVFLNFGNVIQQQDIDMTQPDGLRYQQFNNILRRELETLVYEIPSNEKKQRHEILSVPVTLTERIFLFIPAVLGALFHAPLYLPIKKFSLRLAAHNDHYDSVLVALLLFTYPFYLLAIVTALYFLIGQLYVLLFLLILPLLAWCTVRLKRQV